MTDITPENLITKFTQFIERSDGSEVKIVATAYTGIGLHVSVGVDVFKRENSDAKWALCNDRAHPDWRKMSVDDYVKNGRSEKYQAATHGEIFKVSSMIGKPFQEQTSIDSEEDLCVERPRG